MKRLTDRIKTILTDKRGESLVESLASMMLFTLLMINITMMINTSLQITGVSTVNAKNKQDNANKYILEIYDSKSSHNLILRDDMNGINVAIPVDFSDDGNFTAFSPR